MDELLARGSLALPALVRARVLLVSVLRKPGARSAARAAACLRRCAEALHDAADALELWAGWAKLFGERFGGDRGRG
jgi:ribosomal protein L40E